MNGQSLEDVEKFCYPGDKNRARGNIADNALAEKEKLAEYV